VNVYLSIAIGGAVGACARYSVASMALRVFGYGYPIGTLVVNVLGSLMMGMLVETMALKWSPAPEIRSLLVTGFLGAFTTFSAFSLDAALQIQKGEYALAGGYILLSVILSIGGLFAGLQLMRLALT
jgi:fluoride exporter